MTTQPSSEQDMPGRSHDPSADGSAVTVTVAVDGDLDYETSGDLLEAVTAALAERPKSTVLLLDCAGMTLCDSMGLSALLQIRRDTLAAGRSLRIHPRPPLLDRLLDLTGTADYLLSPAP
jgi:anti-anti-sigma factor